LWSVRVMPTSILKSASSSKKRKSVRLQLDKFDVQEISPTNKQLKSELFYNASDFASFRFDAEYGAVIEQRRRAVAARQERERDDELRRQQEVLWGDQQLRNSDTLRAILARAAAAFSAAPPSHKRARDPSDEPLPYSLQHASAPSTPPVTASMASDDVLEPACRRQRYDAAPDPATTASLCAPAAASGTTDAALSGETTVPDSTTSRATAAGPPFAPSAHRAAMIRQPASLALPRIPSCGGALMRTDTVHLGVGEHGVPDSVSVAPAAPTDAAGAPLLDRSNRDDGPRGGRLKSEIDGLTMAQLRQRIQDVTRRRRARHSEAMAALSTHA